MRVETKVGLSFNLLWLVTSQLPLFDFGAKRC